jgi:glucan 1,3-beta-glucosidase
VFSSRLIVSVGIGIAALIVILVISITAAVVASKKSSKVQSSAASSSSKPPNSNLNGISQSSIPASAKGTYLDPFSWYDTMDFNVTYTDATIGGLPIMGLNSTWDDSVQANPNVPALSSPFAYGSTPVRGMNVGGWLAIEPFITPSLFSKWKSSDGVVDEWTLTSKLGGNAASTLEPHYSSFITKQTFADIRAAGFDHVRIPFSYWAVVTYPGDPYVAKISWRYLLRGIEYARQNGLRVNLDLHGIPGSQNGWNHSGRQGSIGWLNGTDGALNAQRSLDIHNQLSQFFAQPRYKNIVTMYGLVNEPRMVALNVPDVVNWTQNAVQLIRQNNLTAIAIFGDGFLGLDNWKGQLQNVDNLLLDVHQYVIFNDGQIVLKHQDKLNFACAGWTAQMQRSLNKNTGFGPTMCGEWSQADTDCAQYLNDVGVGSRWEGTLNSPDPSQAVLTPQCPTKNNPQCECTDANANPSSYSAAYKQWLLAFAEAQMQSFEYGWGWFYWTWQTETAVQWSWKLGVQAGILPKTVRDRSFNCNDTMPSFAGLPENY